MYIGRENWMAVAPLRVAERTAQLEVVNQEFAFTALQTPFMTPFTPFTFHSFSHFFNPPENGLNKEAAVVFRHQGRFPASSTRRKRTGLSCVSTQPV
jgi:hypothetical protein